KLSMPMSEDHQYLRTSILPELLRTLGYNLARSERDIAYYEMGSIFVTSEKELTKQPKEKLRLSGAFTGMWLEDNLQQEKKPVYFYDVKRTIEGLFTYLRLTITIAPKRLDHMHPGRCATIAIGDQIIGYLGQVQPVLAQEMDLNE